MRANGHRCVIGVGPWHRMRSQRTTPILGSAGSKITVGPRNHMRWPRTTPIFTARLHEPHRTGATLAVAARATAEPQLL